LPRAWKPPRSAILGYDNVIIKFHINGNMIATLSSTHANERTQSDGTVTPGALYRQAGGLYGTHEKRRHVPWT